MPAEALVFQGTSIHRIESYGSYPLEKDLARYRTEASRDALIGSHVSVVLSGYFSGRNANGYKRMHP